MMFKFRRIRIFLFLYYLSIYVCVSIYLSIYPHLLVGCTLLSGDVIKKVVNGLVNIDAYKSNRSEIVGNWTQDGELGEYLYEEKLLGIGCIAVMLGKIE